MEKGKKVSRGYVPWDDEMDKVLLDTFVEHYKKGDRNKLSIDSESVWESYIEKNKEAKGYRNKVIKYRDSINLVYCKDQATGEGARTASESSKEMANKDGNKKDQARSTTTSGSSLKRQRSDDSFTSAWLGRIDGLTTILKDDTPKLLSSAKVLAEDTMLGLYDILTTDAHKFESMMALPVEMRRGGFSSS
ncbi:hypothetical protein QOZ80_1BG0063160 [Eleusine coracana subsp. coracana]|nr:hypothetical protein QOZ80_1BG0063160 [Eleusine coracana subsp. coracana]